MILATISGDLGFPATACLVQDLIGAEAMSAILDYSERTTSILFGDGAGATLIEAVPESHEGRILDIQMGTDGSGAKYLYRTGGGSLHLPGADHPESV